MTSNTQLSAASGYNTNNMTFTKPQMGEIPGPPKIVYHRINIGNKNDDGTVGELVFNTSNIFSFGVSENRNPESGKINGYTLPMCLWNKDGASQEEKDFTDTFNNCVDKCTDHILKHRDDIEQYDLDKNDLKKLNPLYYKREKGKIVEGRGPTLYAKLITRKKDGGIQITTPFDNEETGEEINPLDLVGKYCYVTGVIKFESIFVGNKISLQVKLYEAVIRLLSVGPKRLLTRPKPQVKVSTNEDSVNNALGGLDSEEDSEDEKEDESDDSDGSIDDTSEPKVSPKKTVKRVVRRKK